MKRLLILVVICVGIGWKTSTWAQDTNWKGEGRFHHRIMLFPLAFSAGLFEKLRDVHVYLSRTPETLNVHACGKSRDLEICYDSKFTLVNEEIFDGNIRVGTIRGDRIKIRSGSWWEHYGAFFDFRLKKNKTARVDLHYMVHWLVDFRGWARVTLQETQSLARSSQTANLGEAGSWIEVRSLRAPSEYVRVSADSATESDRLKVQEFLRRLSY